MKLDKDNQPGANVNKKANIDKSIENLLGLCGGLVADQHLNDHEIFFLRNWLDDHALIRDCWPANVLGDRVLSVLADGVINDDERSDLLGTLNQLLGSPHEIGTSSGVSSSLPVTPGAVVSYPAFFCLTGKFVTGTRSKCEDLVVRCGGTPESDVTLKTNYLVIGDLASRDWKFSSFGRKIERAMDLREKGQQISILSEEMWMVGLKSNGVV